MNRHSAERIRSTGPAAVTRRSEPAQENTMEFRPRTPGYARHVFCSAASHPTKSAHRERRERALLSIRTILHATDFSEPSEFAFQFACDLARDYGAVLVILHVYPTPVLPTLNGKVFPLPVDVPRKDLTEMLDAIKPSEPAITVERILVVGAPAYEISRVAEAYHADLIVMGTHGRGGLSRLVMGSVAEDVLRNAQCPVLTVRCKQAVRAEPIAPGCLSIAPSLPAR